MAYRFFIQPKEIKWNEKTAVILDPEQTYKISNVLRLRENEQIVLLDGSGLVYNAQIASFHSRKVHCRLLSRMSVSTEPSLKITLAQSLLKGSKFDYVLQKNTEIGICEFIPVTTEKCIIKIPEDNLPYNHTSKEKTNRYQKIATGAAEQSERGIVPVVQNVMTFEELCNSNLAMFDLMFICLERSQSNNIKEILNSIQNKIQKVLILIGPEGGFSENEVKLAASKGFTPVNLGKRIYRSETVGIVVSSILFFYFNDLK